jgi:hypothetical protein
MEPVPDEALLYRDCNCGNQQQQSRARELLSAEPSLHLQEWRYDDGSRYYSPSSFHRMTCDSVTG